MRDRGAVGGGGLRRSGVEPPVDLERVATDDLAADRFRDARGDPGLAGPRGTDQDEEEWLFPPRSIRFRVSSR